MKLIVFISLIILLGLAGWLVSNIIVKAAGYSGDRVGTNLVTIEQEVTVRSVLDDTYFVQTKVWVRTLWGWAVSLEYSATDVVTKDKIEWMKASQMADAKVVHDKIIKKLNQRSKFKE